MDIREATQDDESFIVAANMALARETEGQTLDPALLSPGVRAVLDGAVYRGPASREASPPC